MADVDHKVESVLSRSSRLRNRDSYSSNDGQPRCLFEHSKSITSEEKKTKIRNVRPQQTCQRVIDFNFFSYPELTNFFVMISFEVSIGAITYYFQRHIW